MSQEHRLLMERLETAEADKAALGQRVYNDGRTLAAADELLLALGTQRLARLMQQAITDFAAGDDVAERMYGITEGLANEYASAASDRFRALRGGE